MRRVTKSYPLVSVAIATYNGEAFLEEQFDSIYNQTYENIEVVVSDDCSVDGTCKILEEYKQKYGLQYSINKKNLGYARNFERVLSFCRGQYIALADQDDIWLPEKLEQLLNDIGNYSLIFSDAILIDSDGNKICESFKKNAKYLADTETPFLQLCFRKFIYGCTMFFRSELLEKALPIPYGICHHDWWLPVVAAKNGGIKFLNRKLMLYRQHDNSTIGYLKDQNLFTKLLGFFLLEEREKRKEFRTTLRKNFKATLNSNIKLEDDERTLLTESIYYFDSFLSNKLNVKDLRIAYKLRNLLFSRSYYITFEIIYRLLNKFLKL